MGTARLKIQTIGQFRMVLDGRPVTPRLSKSQAIIAVIALKPQRSASRKWLQTLLWPDRSPQQASGSLRACLKEIRKIFAEAPECIQIDRSSIALADEFLEMDLDASGYAGDQEILEGFDVPNAEPFEDWLRIIRSSHNEPNMELVPSPHYVASQTMKSQDCGSLYVKAEGLPDSGNGQQHLISVLDSISSLLRERTNLRIKYSEPIGNAEDRSTYALAISSSAIHGRHSIHFRLTEVRHKELLWTKTFQFENQLAAQTDEVLQMINCVADLVDHKIMQMRGIDELDRSTELLNRGIARIGALDKFTWLEADDWLDQSYALRPSAISLAWRSYLRTLMLAERQDTDVLQTSEEGIEFARRAMELDPTNSMVMSLSAHSMSLLTQSYDVSLELSEKALVLNPANAFALSTKGVAQAHLGYLKDGHENAMRAQKIGCFSKLKPFLDLSAAITATLAQDFNSALRYARICCASAPNLGAPLRYLTALSFHQGDEQAGYANVRKLRELENDFEFRWFSEADYPASGIRKSGILDAVPSEHK